MTGAAARLERELLDLEVSSGQLRADPSGKSWLPAELVALVEQDPDGPRVLREFVDLELAMFDEGRGPSDALFTSKVMRGLPDLERADSLRRHVILASAHALAIGVAYLLVWPLYVGGYFQPWVGNAQRWVDNGVQSAGYAGLGGLLGLGLLALTLALLPRLGSGQLGREA